MDLKVELTLNEKIAHTADIRLRLSTDGTDTIWFTTITDLGVMTV